MKKDMISSVQIRSGLDDMPSKYSQNARKQNDKKIKREKYANSKGNCSTHPE